MSIGHGWDAVSLMLLVENSSRRTSRPLRALFALSLGSRRRHSCVKRHYGCYVGAVSLREASGVLGASDICQVPGASSLPFWRAAGCGVEHTPAGGIRSGAEEQEQPQRSRSRT